MLFRTSYSEPPVRRKAAARRPEPGRVSRVDRRSPGFQGAPAGLWASIHSFLAATIGVSALVAFALWVATGSYLPWGLPIGLFLGTVAVLRK